MAYLYFRELGNTQLAAIGLLSFAAIAQFAPSFFGGLVWRRATALGAIGGMAVGFVTWAYTLFMPSFLESSTAGLLWLQHGPFDIEALRPRALFGADLPPLLHGVLWSLSLNVLTYVGLSLLRRPSAIERLQAEVFVPAQLTTIAPPFLRWRSTVTVQDILGAVAQYLGPERAKEAFRSFAANRRVNIEPAAPADFELLQHAEHLIASSIGSASSRLVLSLLLRKRTVSAEAALKLLDDSHAALHFNREILQTALNHVRQGIAVFNPKLQLICSNRQFGEILSLPPHIVQIGVPLLEILDFLALSAPAIGDHEAQTQMRLAAYTTEGAPFIERIPDRHLVIEVRANRMPDGGLVITFSDVTPSFEAAEALERANATLEKRVRDRTEELMRLNSALALAKSTAEEANISKTRFLAAASHDILQPLNAARLYVTSLVEKQGAGEDGKLVENIDAVAGGDRGHHRRAAGHLAARRRRDDDRSRQLRDRRSDALAGDRIRADRPRQGAEARLRAEPAGGAVRPAAAAPAVAEPDLERDQIHAAGQGAGRLSASGPIAADRNLRHRRRHSRAEARRDLQGIPSPGAGRADRPWPRPRAVDRRAAGAGARPRHCARIPTRAAVRCSR